MYCPPQGPYGTNPLYGYQGYQTYQQNLQAPPGYVPNAVQSQSVGYGLPTNISKIDFNAPVIHFGTNVNQMKPQAAVITSAPVLVSRTAAVRDTPSLLQPPTVEQQLRTLFICSIPDYLDDFWIDKILKSVAKLKEWKRASNATGSLRNFGFAEYDDPEHVQRAIIALENLVIPPLKGDGEGSKIMVVVDQKTREYLDEWNETRENKNPQRDRSLIMQAKSNLTKVLEDFKDPNKRDPKKTSSEDSFRDLQASESKDTSKVVTVTLNVDDELEDIPVEHREAVAREISSFRERSERREHEKLKREEETERRRLELERMSGLFVSSKFASQSNNSISQRARNNNIQPPNYSDDLYGQMSKDYQKSITFVSKESNGYVQSHEDELDDTRTCEEIEKERRNRKQKELEAAFQEREKRWLNREKSRTSALEREMNRDKEEAFREARDREIMSRRLAEWNDDLEAEAGVEEYYKDRSSWLRHRAIFRTREMEMDARDRALEEREEVEKSKASTNVDFLSKKQAAEYKHAESGISKDSGIGPIRLTLGSAKKQTDVPKRVVSEVEKLLEDDDDHYTGNKKPVLLPLEYDDTEAAEDDESKIRRIKEIVASVPSEKEGLWSWSIKWDRLTESIIEEKIQPFITKKIVEYVGVQEDDLIKFILDHLRKKGSAEELAKELEMAMDEEAELFVNKVYRYVIVISEACI
ncbi:hypothetical protein PNEG_03570 [Pneumocystis murina B123]|uniref:PWI domain-containing protein n=1 Tax=Pneumocystis murina (strain B123) TaxID=1069680 RepID=M7NLQ9_PNEMU|nr:hypothetical protein PNEG_03570 [Pneumocystis murina B123]EMR08132.1 hypothetical protein PNEG_03570 [Pneumocystis murina B123]